MTDYPLLGRVKERLKIKGENTGWLIGQIGRSPRWLDLITDIKKVQVGDILNLSKALEFDFMGDYYEWIGREVPVLSLLREPEIKYDKPKGEEITLSLTVRGDVRKASQVLENIKAIAAKDGYKVD
ncbi:MAG: hypothetical protein V4619_15540 [Bacteroidota bacterium]